MFSLFLATLTGAGIGLQSALSPGPLMAMILGESIRSGRRAGIRIGLIPLLTDPIMILIALIVVAQLPDTLLGVISFFGAAVLFRLGWVGIRSIPKTELNHSKKSDRSKKSEGLPIVAKNPPKTFWAAVAANFLNPNLYIFSFSVHSIQLIQFWKSGFFPPIAYMVSFFIAMCGINTLIALLANTFSHRLSGKMLYRFNLFFNQLLFFIGILFVIRGIFFLIG